MRTLPPSLVAHLAGQATTTCFCWRVTRTDGVALGFADHDEPVDFEATRFEAASGLSASEAEHGLGLAADTKDVAGAFSSDAIREADVAAGRFDGARVETFLVNWAAPAERVLLEVGEIGEVQRRGLALTAELRGIAARLDQTRGRFYRRRCDAELGDARCGFDLRKAGFAANLTVAGIEPTGAVLLAATDNLDPSLFEAGRLAWTNGPAAGLSSDLASFRRDAGTTYRATFLDAPPRGLAAGQSARLTAGCDKSFATCRARFDNGLNFRGFPHLPGNDAALAFAKKDGRHDGSPVVP